MRSPGSTSDARPIESAPHEQRLESYSHEHSAPWPKHILVCSDGSPTSEPALLTARWVSERSGARVDIVTVHVPEIAVPAMRGRGGLSQCEAPERGRAAALLRNVRLQRRAIAREPRNWMLHAEVGNPVAVIPHLASELDADLIVVGIGAAEPARRAAGLRTPAFIARESPIPVLAAYSGCEAPMRCVLASPYGCAHASSVRRSLARIAPDARVWAVTSPLSADAASDMLRLAGDVQAQLIAVCIHGSPGAVRSFLPNVAESVLVSARCSVLVVPDEWKLPEQ